MFQHILIATDLSDHARKGVTQGLELAQAIGAKATILTVSEPLRPETIDAIVSAGIGDPVVRYDQQIAADMQARFAKLQETTQRYDVTVDLQHEIDESPAEAIVRYADLNGCDLIVMTTHGRRGLRKLVLGSQTSEVLASASIPVLVIR